jgi:4-aminobutyrate aminotransferase-like enzyme/Ser/Thr protein kinase RdoA (MazF antagonist)
MPLEERVAPPVTEIEAARIAQEIYGLDAHAFALPGEYDDNFHLRTSDGLEFVLKLMHPARERSFIDMQCQALSHLAVRAPRLALPRVCPSTSREPFTQVRLADGSERFVWMLTFLQGTVLAKVRPHTPELLRSLGNFLGEMDAALSDFSHPATRRELKWDLSRASWIRGHIDDIKNASRRGIVERILDLYELQVMPAIPQLRHSVIYGDANDYNVLVSGPWPQPQRVASVIDFGDLHFGLTVSELAIAAAYAILGKRDPLSTAAAVVEGYHAAYPLQEKELAELFPLIAARLAVSVVNSAHRKALFSGDPYITVTEAAAWDAMESLDRIHPRFAHYTFRAACGLPAVPQSPSVVRWLENNARHFAPVADRDLRDQPCIVFDLSVGSAFLGANPANSDAENLSRSIFSEMQRASVAVGIGRYNEPRLLYNSPLFGESCNPTDERRTIHLGLDLFVKPGTPVHAPFDGTVHLLANNTAPLDYGPLVILSHETGAGEEFFTLYGHLAGNSRSKLKTGQHISRGECFAHVGEPSENGGWPPHLHFQLILDLLDLGKDFPGVAYPSQRLVWTSLSPDPNMLLQIPQEYFPEATPARSETLSVRRKLLGNNLSLSYKAPLKIVRGWMQYLFDESGRAYLDVYNNVPLVGHSHPRVVRAAQQQLALLNSNTRYLHDNVNRYAERLTALLPEPLRVCYFLNSGTEANELALRLARAHTRKEDVVVLEHAYHGHTGTLIDISPYKFDGPGGAGRKPWVHVAKLPDDYRGAYRRCESGIGTKYARDVANVIDRARADGRGVAAYIAETMPSVGGQIFFPEGYLAETYKYVRAAGAVCIADEVQVGFGRLGTHFWGFETQGVVPDIVVLGKPIGNGFPLAAVITTAGIAASFANGMEFFSTFGGNPVAAAAGIAVLDVLEEEKLQGNALRVGQFLIAGLKELQKKYALIGDVRGSGLFLGIDLVRDRETRAPATDEADYVVNRLRDCGILAGTDGPYHNVLKLRPPLMFREADAELFIPTLASVLEEDAAQPASRQNVFTQKMN